MMVIEGELLLAMGRVLGMIQVEDNGGRRLGIAGNEVVHEGLGEPVEIRAGHPVFESGEGGGTRQILCRIKRDTFHTQFKHGIVPETVRIIPISIARSNLIDPLGEEVAQRVVDIRRMAFVAHRGGQPLGEADLSVNPSEQEGAKVGGQRPAIKIGVDRVSRYRRKVELFWRRIRHKQTSWGFDGIGAVYTLFYQRLT